MTDVLRDFPLLNKEVISGPFPCVPNVQKEEMSIDPSPEDYRAALAGLDDAGGVEVAFEHHVIGGIPDVEEGRSVSEQRLSESGPKAEGEMSQSSTPDPSSTVQTCRCSDKHRPLGSRWWCHSCREYCYDGDPDLLCLEGIARYFRAECDDLRQQLDAVKGTLAVSDDACAVYHEEMRAKVKRLEQERDIWKMQAEAGAEVAQFATESANRPKGA